MPNLLFGGFLLQQSVHAFRVMEAAVWAVARWADTYLLSQEEDLSPAMAQSFGAAGNSPSVLAALVQLAGILLNYK